MQRKTMVPKRLALFYGMVLMDILLLTGALLVHSFIPDEHLRTVIVYLIYLATNALAVLALTFAAMCSAQRYKRLGIAWGVLALAQFAYMLGDLIWGIMEEGLGKKPFPSPADGAYLAYYLLFLAGVFILPIRYRAMRERLKVLLDMSIIMLAIGLGLWNLLIGPLAANSHNEPLFTQLLSLAYPVGDLMLILALLMLLYQRDKEANPASFWLLTIAAVIMVVTDSLFTLQSLQGTYTAGNNLGTGWLLVYILIGLAGMLQILTVTEDMDEVKVNIPHLLPLEPIGERLLAWMPYAWASFAFLLLVARFKVPMPMSPLALSAGVGGVIALVLVRQLVVFNENSRLSALNSQLHLALARIQQQAGELEKANKSLYLEIAERQRAEEKLSYDALHDTLTGLPNRALFMDRVRHAIDYYRRNTKNPFTVLFLDLDDFKVVNDSLGHLSGDQLLMIIAQRLKSRLRASDTVARLGGDEFVILIENILEEKDIRRVAENVLEALKAPIDLQDYALSVSGSMGIVQCDESYTSPEDVLRDADIAMYRAKALGKARYQFFTADLRTEVINRLDNV